MILPIIVKPFNLEQKLFLDQGVVVTLNLLLVNWGLIGLLHGTLKSYIFPILLHKITKKVIKVAE